jgi:hypothetical protein
LSIEKPYPGLTTLPVFQGKTLELVDLMKTKSTKDIATLMHLSSALAELNYQRYQHFSTEYEVCSQIYPALFLFQGDVYKGLQASEWDSMAVNFSQKHLLILSGLYGLLKPLDLMQPYRLEMGTKLVNQSGKNLYDYWSQTITQELNTRLSNEANPLLINLASTEYFKVVDMKTLRFPLIHIHFKEQMGNQLKIIGIHAKKARGAMASYLMQHQIDGVEGIKHFNALDYNFCKTLSDKQNFVFSRVKRGPKERLASR